MRVKATGRLWTILGFLLIVGLLFAFRGQLLSLLPGQSPISQSPTTASVQPTAAPQVQPTAANTGGDTTTQPQPTAASQAQPTTAPQASEPSSAPASRGTIVYAFDAFPSYYPGIIMKVRGLLEKRGYELQLVPFGLDGTYPTEADRWNKMRSGEWDVLATTLDGLAKQSDPNIGAITAIIDESAGADKLVVKPEINTINDLRGRRIAYSVESVGEYFVYYSLSLAGLNPQDVQLVPANSVADAVALYTSGQVDAVSAWEPDVLDAEAAGGKVLIASDKLRAIVDVLVTSRNAINTKPEGVQAFHDAWFEALKLMTDAPDQAEQALLEWGNPDWSYITAPGDLQVSLEKLAQAPLGANLLAFQNSATLVARLTEARDVWARAGQATNVVNLNDLVVGNYIQTSSANQQLYSAQPPVNSSFLLTARVTLPQLSPEEIGAAQAVVTLPLEQINFEPDSLRLTEQSQNDLLNQVVPVLRTSQLYIKIDGSSAWPGPEGRFSYEQIQQFARDRANSVATFLVTNGIDPSRVVVGTIDPQFPNSVDESQLAQDRRVRFTLITAGGR